MGYIKNSQQIMSPFAFEEIPDQSLSLTGGIQVLN